MTSDFMVWIDEQCDAWEAEAEAEYAAHSGTVVSRDQMTLWNVLIGPNYGGES